MDQDGNVNCVNCVNCTGCVNCRDCTNCHACVSCTGCSNLNGAVGNNCSSEKIQTRRLFLDQNGNINCVNCVNCQGCVNCSDCIDCNGSVECRNCRNCNGCVKCTGCSNLQGAVGYNCGSDKIHDGSESEMVHADVKVEDVAVSQKQIEINNSIKGNYRNSVIDMNEN